MQFLEDDKFGLLIFHAENLDGVLELDNGQSNCDDTCAYDMSACLQLRMVAFELTSA